MSEAWHFMPGRGIWNLCRRGDEARLHFCFAKIRAVIANQSADWCGNLTAFCCVERVTRLVCIFASQK